MDRDDNEDTLNRVLNESGKINEILNDLHEKFINQGSTVSYKITEASKALECALEIIVRNTDIKTNEIHHRVFENFKKEIVLNELHKIGLLGRRIERELREHFKDAYP